MRLFGHPLHPMLVHFPVALWSVGSACDVLALAGVEPARTLAWLAIAVGTGFALVTMAAGLIDFATLEDRAVPIALRHMALIGVAWSLYAISLVLRSDGLAPASGSMLLPAICGFAGFVALIAGAWHGGQLVYRMGAGVER